jgi:hypothetical protein
MFKHRRSRQERFAPLGETKDVIFQRVTNGDGS